MTTLEDLERIVLMHKRLAIREHEERLSAMATSNSPGTCTAVGHEAGTGFLASLSKVRVGAEGRTAAA